LLTNCVVCPVTSAVCAGLWDNPERHLWRWLTKAGLKLTMAELTFLSEHGVEPVPELLGPDNRQALTEIIYTAETIADSILEARMENSPAREQTVRSVLKLLRKDKIFLI
jgi:hypothetical protein